MAIVYGDSLGLQSDDFTFSGLRNVGVLKVLKGGDRMRGNGSNGYRFRFELEKTGCDGIYFGGAGR